MSFARPIASRLDNPTVRSANLPRANVLGVGVHAIDLPQAAETICTAITTGRKGYVCVTGVHGVMEAQRSPTFRSILERALLVTPDGMPTVWVGRIQGHTQMARVFGPDLMLDVCSRSVPRGFSHFLYGGKPGVAERLSCELTRRFPGIKIAGCYHPPFRPLSQGELAELEGRLTELRPDIVWIGLGTPKQERFMAEYAQKLSCKIMIGVGAAFDFHTGELEDSPTWAKNAGLQWAHRLWQEPSRLWKRYLVNNSQFVLKIFLQMAGLKKYSLDYPQHV